VPLELWFVHVSPPSVGARHAGDRNKPAMRATEAACTPDQDRWSPAWRAPTGSQSPAWRDPTTLELNPTVPPGLTSGYPHESRELHRAAAQGRAAPAHRGHSRAGPHARA